ncbi:MAG TPA: carboxypeptidase-like regulatory domain-containing protein, partial [Terriglobia bacterium]|nr:carboxypeptidase-like regulatory domain-containing protein [Terriglobia bacterium]
MKLGLIVLAGLLLSTREALAQSALATITGTVRDVSGAVIADAQVVATSPSNNVQSTTATNAMGTYTLLDLPVGQYTLTCSKAGFARYERTGINLAITEVAEIDMVIKISAAAQTTVVTADAPLLQTQTSSISTNLNNAAITELPLNVQGGRNLSAFMFAYVPGVEGGGSTAASMDFDSHINGIISSTKEVMIDGTSAVSQIGGYLSESSPPMEAVQEFQVTSAGIRADDGRTGGGVFRYEMKSGTNAWHGSGFYYMHNEALDARSFSDKYNEGLCLGNADGDPAQVASCERGFGKPEDRLYDYGASIGGPIKRNKLFFYSAFERYTFANAGIGALSSTVPTMAFLNGDFSALLNKSVVLGTDDAGQTVYQGSIINPATGDVFPGNMIPPGDISQVSQRIVNLYKQYYQPLSSGLTNNNALPANSPATWYESDEFSVKLDYNASASHRVDGSFIYAYTPRLLSNQGGIWSAGSTDGGPMANAYDHNTKAPSARARDSWTLSSTRLNVFSVTFNRFYVPSIARSRQGNWPATLGLGDFGAGNFPIIEFQGLNGTEQRFVDGQPIDESNLGSQFNDEYAANTIIFDDTLSWVRGRHTYRFGGEVRIQQLNSDGDHGVPTFIFDPAQTAGNFGASFAPCQVLNECAGFGFASFLLGAYSGLAISGQDDVRLGNHSFGLYAQDSWKVTRKLTIDYGL